jgi:hypothetical protein
MNNEEFLKRLSEVAVWARPMTGPGGYPSVRRGFEAKEIPKPDPVTEAELNEMSDAEVEAYYDQLCKWRESQPNPSVGPEILELKPCVKPCEDCGKELSEPRKIECKKYDSAGGHWRTRCVNCTNFKHPLTKEYSVSQASSHQFFLDFYRPKQGKYKSKYQPMAGSGTRTHVEVEVLKDKIREYTVVETDESVIRSLDKQQSDNS